MSWRVANSIKVLFDEVNSRWPNRDKASDGTIGDADHQSRTSDHNPWVRDGDIGVVTAADIDHDPKNGPDSRDLAEHFRLLGKNGDSRVKYVISFGRIASSIADWQWRVYNGVNAHKLHCHLSVSSDKQNYDSNKSWGISNLGSISMEGDVAQNIITKDSPVYQIKRFQKVIKNHPKGNDKLNVDGKWGPKTDTAWKQLASNTPWTHYVEFAIREVDYFELRLDIIEAKIK